MLKAGSPAPDAQRFLNEAPPGAPVLVAFFKVSCPTCQFTFPYLQRFADRGLTVIGVSQDNPHLTDAFRERFGLRFPLCLDAAAAGYPASNAYGITHVPSLFLVNAEGIIEHAVEGFSREDFESIGARFGFVPFSAAESIPAFRPG